MPLETAALTPISPFVPLCCTHRLANARRVFCCHANEPLGQRNTTRASSADHRFCGPRPFRRLTGPSNSRAWVGWYPDTVLDQTATLLLLLGAHAAGGAYIGFYVCAVIDWECKRRIHEDQCIRPPPPPGIEAQRGRLTRPSPYLSWCRTQAMVFFSPSSLRPLGVRSMKLYAPTRRSRPRA